MTTVCIWTLTHIPVLYKIRAQLCSGAVLSVRLQ